MNQEWQGKLCPLLTMAQLGGKEAAKGAKPAIALAPGMTPKADMEALSCQGPGCMWFMSRVEQDSGKSLGGDCCVSLLTSAVNQQTMVMYDQKQMMAAALSKLAHIGAATDKS